MEFKQIPWLNHPLFILSMYEVRVEGLEEVIGLVVQYENYWTFEPGKNCKCLCNNKMREIVKFGDSLTPF